MSTINSPYLLAFRRRMVARGRAGRSLIERPCRQVATSSHQQEKNDMNLTHSAQQTTFKWVSLRLAAGKARGRQLACAVSMLGLCVVSQAASVAVSATSIGPGTGSLAFGNPCVQPSHLIDQSGLSANYVSGVTAFATAISATHISTPCNSGAVIAAGAFTPGHPVFTFALGGGFAIDAMALWTINSPSGAFGQNHNWGSIWADDDGIFGNNSIGEHAVGAFNAFNPIALASTPTSALVFNFSSPVTSPYLHLYTTNGEGNVVEFGEVAFRAAAVPEPATLSLAVLGLGVLGLGWHVRRKGLGARA
jgi:hypothetical protein